MISGAAAVRRAKSPSRRKEEGSRVCDQPLTKSASKLSKYFDTYYLVVVLLQQPCRVGESYYPSIAEGMGVRVQRLNSSSPEAPV